MDKQKITDIRRKDRKNNIKGNILKITLFLILLLVTFFFLKWLYLPRPITTLNDNTTSEIQFDSYNRNPYVHLINNAIPAARTSYEVHFGRQMSGLIPSMFQQTSGNKAVDLKNPITYLNFVFAAFGQGNSSQMTANNGQGSDNKNGKLLDIKDFKDAPEGDIYFNEEDEQTDNTDNSIDPKDKVPPAESSNIQITDDELSPPEKLALEKKSPQILIYHTHATESYMPSELGNFHTLNEKYNVLSVGNIMTNVLQKKYKYKVIHDKTYHDKESYIYSYTNSLLTVRKQIAANKSIKVILDVHRDAFSVSAKDRSTRKEDYTTTINGKKAAKVMLVIGGKNPNYKELERFGVYIKKKMEKLYPGLFLKIVRQSKSKYNQYYSDYSMLIEVGCMLNTDEEAKYSGELMGNVIGEVLKDLRE